MKEKLYGIYEGCIKDKEVINNLNELELFWCIYELGNYLWECENYINKDGKKHMNLDEELYALEYMIYQTTKFGVKLEKSLSHLKITDSYRKWYKYYADYYEYVLNDIEREELGLLIINGFDTTKYLPQNHYVKNRKYLKKII